jgi:YHS domain-containing protein
MNENMKQGLMIGLSVMIGFAVALFLQQLGVLNLNHSGSVTAQDQTSVEVAQPQTTVQPGETQPAVQGVPQLRGGCCGVGRQNTVQNGPLQGVEVGNKHCPVTGNPVDAMGGPIKHLYNGKIYNLCCPMCPHTFDSNPAYYAKIAEDDARGQ